MLAFVENLDIQRIEIYEEILLNADRISMANMGKVNSAKAK